MRNNSPNNRKNGIYIIIACVLLWNGIPMLISAITFLNREYMNSGISLSMLGISVILVLTGIRCIFKAKNNSRESKQERFDYNTNTKKSNINNTKQFKTKSFSTKPFETRYKSPTNQAKRKYSEGDNFFELESKYEKSWLDKEREAENKRIARQKSTGEF